MKHFLIILFLATFQVIAFGQSNTITGKVNDKDGAPIEYASTALIKLPDSIVVATFLTDSLGQFHFSNIKAGEYTVKGFLFGYNDKFSERLSIDSSSSVEVNLVLEDTYMETQEVVIRSERPSVRQEADKMVVNVENSVTNSGLTVLDVLRKSPGVAVDKDDVISLKGKKGVLVMIDDKPLYLSMEQVGNLLKSIPSDQVKELEIITSPSAKYDAAGNAGIINIRLKKGVYEGLNADFTGSFGHGVYHKANGGVSVTYKKKRLSLSGGYQYNNKQGLNDYFSHRKFTDAGNPHSQFNSDSYFKNPFFSHSLIFGSQYKVNDKSDVNLDLSSVYSEYGWRGGSTSRLYNQDGNIENSFDTREVGASKPLNINVNLGHRVKLDTNGTLLSTAVSYNKNFGRENKDINIQYFDAFNQSTGNFFTFSSNQHYVTDQFSAKSDFTKYIFKKSKWESGVKANMSTTDFPTNILINDNGALQDASNHFVYKENIFAAYTMMNKVIGKWKVQGGLRLEKTHIVGVQSINDSTFKRDYLNLFPSASINYNVTPKTSYTLLYSRRIQRPTVWQLNPVRTIQDPYTTWGGNPYLLPQYTDNIEFAYSMFSGFIITTVGYSYSVHPTLYATRVNPTTLKTEVGHTNMKSQTSTGISVTANMPVTKWWTTSNYVQVFNNRYVGDLGFGLMDNQQVSWLVNSTQTFKLPKRFTIEVSGVYEPSSAYGLSTSYTRGQLNIGLHKKFWDNRASIKLALSDIFWSYKYGSKAILGNTIVTNNYKWDNRVLMLTLSYKVGKRAIVAISN